MTTHLSSSFRLWAIALLILVGFPCVAARRNFTVCGFTGGWLTTFSVVHHHAIEWFSATNAFPEITMNYKALRGSEPGSNAVTTKQLVKAWVVNGSHCDAALGPGSSNAATALSPVIEVPWLDGSSSSSELSNKARHPFFSRVIPTDDRGTFIAMRVMEAFGWRDFNVITSDLEYGRSLTDGIHAAANAANATVHVSVKIPSTTARTADDLFAAVDRILATSPARVVFFAGLLLASEFKALRKRKIDEQLVFIFPDGACSSGSATDEYTMLSGSLCTSYSYDDAAALAFAESFKNRSTAAEDEVMMAAGVAPVSPPRRTISIYGALNFDAVGLMATALSRFTLMYPGASTLGNTAAIAALRGTTFHGATGVVALDSNGNRPSADAVLFSTNSGNLSGHTAIGRVNASGVFFSSTRVRFLGSMHAIGSASLRNVALRPENTESGSTTSQTVFIAVIIAGAVVVVFTISVGIVVMKCLHYNSRDNNAAPKDATAPFTIVFTDIQASTTLWSAVPEVMSTALDLHNDTMRRLIARHHGYEVKTIGDSFMVAFTNAIDGAKFALAVQTEFMEVAWDEAIEETYTQLLADISGTTGRSASCRTWPGLRVRIGVHFGTGSIAEDPTTGGFDYYGTVVNTAARVEAVGHGGQVLLSQEAFDAAGGPDALSLLAAAHMALGSHTLRGLSEPVTLIQLLPLTVSYRAFPPLRIESAAYIGEIADAADDPKHRRSFMDHSDVASGADIAAATDDIGAKVAKVMFSALSVSERASVVALLGKRWHVGNGNKSALEKNAPQMDRAVASIGLKCNRVLSLQALRTATDTPYDHDGRQRSVISASCELTPPQVDGTATADHAVSPQREPEPSLPLLPSLSGRGRLSDADRHSRHNAESRKSRRASSVAAERGHDDDASPRSSSSPIPAAALPTFKS